jgi:cell shape-determining protein MreC
MYPDEFKYARALTVTLKGFEKSPTEIVDKVKDMIDNYDKYVDTNNMLKDRLKDFFDGTKLYKTIKESVDGV